MKSEQNCGCRQLVKDMWEIIGATHQAGNCTNVTHIRQAPTILIAAAKHVYISLLCQGRQILGWENGVVAELPVQAVYCLQMSTSVFLGHKTDAEIWHTKKSEAIRVSRQNRTAICRMLCMQRGRKTLTKTPYSFE